MSDTDTDDENDEHAYIHFDTVEECKEFIDYIAHLNVYRVGHTCCDGTGCKILHITNTIGYIIKKEFFKSKIDSHV